MRGTDGAGRRHAALWLWLALLLGCGLVFGTALAGRAAATSCGDEFTGPSGGDWASASNWSGGLPGSATVVCWVPEKTVDVTEASQVAASIAAGGGLVVKGTGRLDLTDGAEASSLSGGVRTAESGQLELAGRLACVTLQLDGGRVLDDGEIDCPVKIATGTLAGTGSVGAAVVNEAGTVEPGDGSAPGGLSFGSYAQGEGADLSVGEDRSVVATLSVHLLEVSGPSSLAGTISLNPVASPTGFPLIESAVEPSGYFSRVIAPGLGSPWTVAYGPAGAAAISGGALPVGVAIAGTPEPGGSLTCGLAKGWQPRGTTAYRWIAPFRESEVLESAVKAPGFSPPPDTLEEQLRAELNNKQVQTITVPGAAVGRRIGCAIDIWTPAGGAASSQHAGGESQALAIGGPFRPTTEPSISGRAIPGARLTCSAGRWEGSPSSYSYAWFNRPHPEGSTLEEVAGAAAYRVGERVEGTLTCVVTAHYGAVTVPAEASVTVPARPQPTLCPRRPVALVSARRSARAVLLFGAAAQRYFGARVYALRRVGNGRWRRVGSGLVNRSGYFELALASSRGTVARGSYRVEIAGRSSNALALPGVLQIVSDRSHPARSQVTLRLAKPGALTIRRMLECEPAAVVASATLPAGGQLHLELIGGSEPVAYLAQARVGRRTFSTELVVPARPQIIHLLG